MNQINQEFAENIYDTLRGNMAPGYEVPGIEDAFAPGGVCDRAYHELREAYDRLCVRLGVGDEDKDVEAIILAGLTIQRELCMRMFRIGMKFGKEDQ